MMNSPLDPERIGESCNEALKPKQSDATRPHRVSSTRSVRGRAHAGPSANLVIDQRIDDQDHHRQCRERFAIATRAIVSADEKADPAVVAANLRKLLQALRTCEMTAPAGTLARIEGIILALEAAARKPSDNQKPASDA